MVYSNKEFSAEAECIEENPKIRIVLTAPAIEWRRIVEYLGEASTQTPFEFYDVLVDALQEVDY